MRWKEAMRARGPQSSQKWNSARLDPRWMTHQRHYIPTESQDPANELIAHEYATEVPEDGTTVREMMLIESMGCRDKCGKVRQEERGVTRRWYIRMRRGKRWEPGRIIEIASAVHPDYHPPKVLPYESLVSEGGLRRDDDCRSTCTMNDPSNSSGHALLYEPLHQSSGPRPAPQNPDRWTPPEADGGEAYGAVENVDGDAERRYYPMNRRDKRWVLYSRPN